MSMVVQVQPTQRFGMKHCALERAGRGLACPSRLKLKYDRPKVGGVLELRRTSSPCCPVVSFSDRDSLVVDSDLLGQSTPFSIY